MSDVTLGIKLIPDVHPFNIHTCKDLTHSVNTISTQELLEVWAGSIAQ